MWTSLEPLFCRPQMGSKERKGGRIFEAEAELCEVGVDGMDAAGKQSNGGVGSWG